MNTNTNPDTLNSDDGPVCEHGVATNYFVCPDCGNQPTDVIQVRFPEPEFVGGLTAAEDQARAAQVQS